MATYQCGGVQHCAFMLLTNGAAVVKGSFGTQSEAGSRFVVSMMTVVATLKQQQRPVLAYLTAAHEAALRGATAPLLLPASTSSLPVVA